VEKIDLVTLTADIVSAHVSNNNIGISDLPTLVQSVYGSLAGLGQQEPAVEEKKQPVVSVRASVKPDYIVCMECGKKQKTLRRHLMTAHQMTPEQYRSDYGLPVTYPMTAPNYSNKRREMAKAIGLGRRRRESDAAASPAQPGRSPRRG
jgi:predicted transcriptional regulator